MSDVALLLPASPEHVRTARLVVVAAARRAGLADELVDEVRFAVGEACARAVGLHRKDLPDERILITVSDEPSRLSVSVTDRGPSASASAGDDAGRLLQEAEAGVPGQDEQLDTVDPDLSIALLNGLVDAVDVSAGVDGTGTVVTLTWPLSPRLLSGAPSTAAVRN